MATKRIWTDEENETIVRLRAEGATWGAVAAAVGAWKQTVILHSHYVLGLPKERPRATASAPTEAVARPRDSSAWDALPAGHPITWGAITRGTLLEGMEWPRRQSRLL